MSIELQTVLHRVRNLEEKHELDAAFVNMLTRELDQFQVQIQELMQEKKKDQEELGYLKHQTSERAVSRENDADLVEDKPEYERALRDHSEKLHHKLDNAQIEVHDNGRKYQSRTDNLAGIDSPGSPRKGQMMQKSLWEGRPGPVHKWTSEISAEDPAVLQPSAD